MEQIKKSLNMIGHNLTDEHVAICILDKEENDEGPAIIYHGDSEAMANALGSAILGGLCSDDPIQNKIGNDLFDATVNAVIGIMAYNDDIYNVIMQRIQKMPGKPIMIAKLNR